MDKPSLPSLPPPQPINGTTTGLAGRLKAVVRRRRTPLLWAGGITAILLATVSSAALIWYQSSLAPVSSQATELIRVDIEPGSTIDGIAEELEQRGVIKSASAFTFYTYFKGVSEKLQAGTYRLSPSESTPKIIGHLQNGKVDTFTITFLPGATVADNRKVLEKAGYSEAEVDAGLAARYDSPLFAGKPETADLEGYIFGETYSISSGASVEDILAVTFDQFNQVVEENNLVIGYQAQGLSLFQGITLASIIQRESGGDDQAQIAQIFLKRLREGMMLGSDVTYQYIADKTGVPRSIDLESPYNTRRYGGLPPGPISTPGVAALKAVANPSNTDYLFFLSGDDNVTYYGRMFEEHEANIRNYCQEKCKII